MNGQRSGNPQREKIGKQSALNAVFASVTRTFLRGGKPWVEAEDPGTGQRWTAPVMAVGSGGAQTLDHTPMVASTSAESVKTTVVLLFPNHMRAPIAIGCMYSDDALLAPSADSTEPGADRTAPLATTDRVILNGGSFIAISDQGDILAESRNALSDGTMRLQLKDTAVLRITRAGANNAPGDAPDRVVLGTPLLVYLAKLEATVTALGARLEVLTQAVNALASGTAAAVHAVYLPPVPVATEQHIKSASIHISAAAEAN